MFIARDFILKALSIAHFVVTQGIDILALTQTWLWTDSDHFVISESVPASYGFLHISRKEGKTFVGVVIIYRSWFNVTINKTKGVYTHFEHMDCSVSVDKMTVNMFIIYRHSLSRQNGSTNSTFFPEWSAYLDELPFITNNIVIMSDLNFYLHNKSNSNAKPFNSILEAHGLRQHVTGGYT